MELVRKQGEMVLRADLPGVEPDEVEVTIEGDVLTVSAEHEESSEEETEGVLHRTRRYASFSRSMPLPEGVTADRIETSAENGVVEVKIPLPQSEEG